MIRKVELHMDALIVIVLLFVAAVGFIVYQRHNYLDLLRDNFGRQMKQLSLEMEVARLEAQLKKATAAKQGTDVAPKVATKAGPDR